MNSITKIINTGALLVAMMAGAQALAEASPYAQAIDIVGQASADQLTALTSFKTACAQEAAIFSNGAVKPYLVSTSCSAGVDTGKLVNYKYAGALTIYFSRPIDITQIKISSHLLSDKDAAKDDWQSQCKNIESDQVSGDTIYASCGQPVLDTLYEKKYEVDSTALVINLPQVEFGDNTLCYCRSRVDWQTTLDHFGRPYFIPQESFDLMKLTEQGYYQRLATYNDYDICDDHVNANRECRRK
jgi:hypothetical protein